MEMSEIRINLVRNKKLQRAVQTILKEIGEDSERDGLIRTPFRVAKAYEELFGGYSKNPKEVLNRTFATDYNEMITVKDIKFASMCEHHILPFVGFAHVSYIPGQRIVGLDKIIKLVEIYARRLQTQEQLTYQIGKAMMDVLNPKGVGVQISAEHFCIMLRETRNQNSVTVTTKLFGEFKKADVKSEFFEAIRKTF